MSPNPNISSTKEHKRGPNLPLNVGYLDPHDQLPAFENVIDATSPSHYRIFGGSTALLLTASQRREQKHALSHLGRAGRV